MKTRTKSNRIIFVVLIIIALIILFPLVIAFINSFKTKREMYISVLALPEAPSFANYIEAFKRMDFLRSLFNTVLITTTSVLGILIVSSMAGYKICRTKTKLSSFFYYFFIFAMLIPFPAVMITISKEIASMNLAGTKTGIILTYIGFGCSQAIFLYHGFVTGVPIDIEEAARIEGCGEFTVFYKIVLPC